MISELHFKILDTANRDLSKQFHKLREARAKGDTDGNLKRAEMDYFHALQHLYVAVQDAVADGSQPSPTRTARNN